MQSESFWTHLPEGSEADSLRVTVRQLVRYIRLAEFENRDLDGYRSSQGSEPGQ